LTWASATAVDAVSTTSARSAFFIEVLPKDLESYRYQTDESTKSLRRTPEVSRIAEYLILDASRFS
jgi:hypothetical protein